MRASVSFFILSIITLISAQQKSHAVHGLVPASVAAKSTAFCAKAIGEEACQKIDASQLGHQVHQMKRLCKDASISKVCGWGGCRDGKNHENCPFDCGEDQSDFNFEPTKAGSANLRTHCDQQKSVIEPTSEAEVIAVVKKALQAGIPLKAVGASHTDNESICTSGWAVATRKMKAIYGTYLVKEGPRHTEVVRTQPGVTIGELGAWLHVRNKSLGFGVVGYELVTLAGVIGTGAHGSALKESAILSDRVVAMKIVQADGTVHEYSRSTTGVTDPDLWNALRLHLGALGIITELDLEITSDFQLEVKTTSQPDTRLFTEGVAPYIRGCDTASIHWFPAREYDHKKILDAKLFLATRLKGNERTRKGIVIVNCGKAFYREPNERPEEFAKKAQPGAQYVLHAPTVKNTLYKSYIEWLHQSACDPSWGCELEGIRRSSLKKQPPYVRYAKGKTQTFEYDPANGIRGWAHAMQNSTGSPQGRSFLQSDWEVAIPLGKTAEAFKVLREFYSAKHRDGTFKNCLPLIGVFMRFSAVNSTLISHAAQGGDFRLGETAAFLEIPQFLPSFNVKSDADKNLAEAIQKNYEMRYQNFSTLLVNKLKARVHIAKNRISLFADQEKDPVRSQQIQKFSEQVKKLDPNGLFKNEFLTQFGVRY